MTVYLVFLNLGTPRRRRRFAGAEDGSRVLHGLLNPSCERMRAAGHAPRDPFRVLARRHGLAEIVESGVGILGARLGRDRRCDFACFTRTLSGLVAIEME